MKHGKLLKYGITFLIFNFCLPAYSKEPVCHADLKLQDYEPNSLVARKDDNDDWNLDFTLSQMFPINHNGCVGYQSSKPDWIAHPYFSFTGRFGFYALEKRDSSPVIGKQFNPKLFARKWIGEDGSYLDIGYAHESNGQSINLESTYLQKKTEIVSRGEREEFANDYLSRGWDYIDFKYKRKLSANILSGDISYYVNFKYFLSDGLLQGKPEEFYSWETSEGKSRDEVDGISILAKYSNITKTEKTGFKTAVTYTTGYKNTFDNNTFKLELTYKIKDWPPFYFWTSKGYNSDLTDYYKDITSIGIGVELRNFLDDY